MKLPSTVRLHVNVDHVATLRNARGTSYPSPLDAAAAAERAGAGGITVHLREDRRHIRDDDVRDLRGRVTTMLNLEMAATDEMLDIALRVGPDLVTLVPERRAERTTEGGLDVVSGKREISAAVARLRAANIPTSLFVAPDVAQLEASRDAGARSVELHTGEYAHAETPEAQARELDRQRRAATAARDLGLEVAAGHGLTRANVGALLAASPEIVELNVGHAIVADAILAGMEGAVRAFLAAMRAGRP